MKFKIFTKEEECKKLWEKYSPDEILWDLWDFNFCFFDPKINEFYFVVGYENDEEVGLLPIQYEKDEDFYGFFGGNYPERRRFFIKDKKTIKEFLEFFQHDLFLEYIDDSEKEFIDGLKDCDIAFSLNLENIQDINSYFASFSKKHKKNIKYDLKHLVELDYKVGWNNVEDFKILVELNKRRFGEESNYFQSGFEDGMNRLVKIAKEKDMLHLVSIKISDKTEATEIGVAYNNTYYVLDGGSNTNIKNIGKLLIIEHIKNAINLKAKKIDFMSSDSGWKKLWNLEETPQLEWMNFEPE